MSVIAVISGVEQGAGPDLVANELFETNALGTGDLSGGENPKGTALTFAGGDSGSLTTPGQATKVRTN